MQKTQISGGINLENQPVAQSEYAQAAIKNIVTY